MIRSDDFQRKIYWSATTSFSAAMSCGKLTPCKMDKWTIFSASFALPVFASFWCSFLNLQRAVDAEIALKIFLAHISINLSRNKIVEFKIIDAVLRYESSLVIASFV